MCKRILTFLWASLICLAILCVAVFGTIARVMVKKSDQTLTEVANLYMEEINGQLQRHFDSLVEMQLAQVEGITLAFPPDSVEAIDDRVISAMTTAARARDFCYLALYNTEGKADVLYGEPVTIREEDSFLASLNRADPKVVLADTADGEGLLLFGVSVGYPVSDGYPMPDGSQCTALLAGVPLDTINDTLSLSINDTLIYSHIIETDGRFVLKNNAEIQEDNYFDWLQNHTLFEDNPPEEVVGELKQAIAGGQMFSAAMVTDGQRRHVYCSPLNNSEWYLISVMPYGALDEAVDNLRQ